MITALIYKYQHEFIEALVRKTFPSESPIISTVIHSAITNLTDDIKLIVTIKLRLDFAKYPITGLQVSFSQSTL